ncbi:hypothetical protein BC830DRAFT_235546 [Chytriomyces sp. MP71]|nr:hypothetical protein BC830DRAFT_235546 [Chytriomyces sp. MP71]
MEDTHATPNKTQSSLPALFQITPQTNPAAHATTVKAESATALSPTNLLSPHLFTGTSTPKNGTRSIISVSDAVSHSVDPLISKQVDSNDFNGQAASAKASATDVQIKNMLFVDRRGNVSNSVSLPDSRPSAPSSRQAALSSSSIGPPSSEGIESRYGSKANVHDSQLNPQGSQGDPHPNRQIPPLSRISRQGMGFSRGSDEFSGTRMEPNRISDGQHDATIRILSRDERNPQVQHSSQRNLISNSIGSIREMYEELPAEFGHLEESENLQYFSKSLGENNPDSGLNCIPDSAERTGLFPHLVESKGLRESGATNAETWQEERLELEQLRYEQQLDRMRHHKQIQDRGDARPNRQERTSFEEDVKVKYDERLIRENQGDPYQNKDPSNLSERRVQQWISGNATPMSDADHLSGVASRLRSLGLPPLHPSLMMNSSEPSESLLGLNGIPQYHLSKLLNTLLDEITRRADESQKLSERFSEGEDAKRALEDQVSALELQKKEAESKDWRIIQDQQDSLTSLTSQMASLRSDLLHTRHDLEDAQSINASLKKRLSEREAARDKALEELESFRTRVEKTRRQNEQAFMQLAERVNRYKVDPTKSGMDRFTMEVIDVYESKISKLEEDLRELRMSQSLAKKSIGISTTLDGELQGEPEDFASIGLPKRHFLRQGFTGEQQLVPVEANKAYQIQMRLEKTCRSD